MRKMLGWIATLGFLLLAGVLPSAVGQQQGSAPQWEYRAVKFAGDEASATRRLNDLVQEGWEYVGPLAKGLVAFKRLDRSRQVMAANEDLARLQGTWYTVSVAEGDGMTGEDRTDTITYDGDKYVQKRNGQVWASGTFKIIDATANPKQIDYIGTEGVQVHYRSIYTLDGDDHKMCSDGANNNRPKAFSGKAGFLRVTKRVK